MRIAPDDNSYGTFCSLVNGYRQLAVIMAAVDCGIIDAVAAGPCRRERLLATTGMKPAEGERFVSLLVSAGILRETEWGLALSRFSATYLSRSSELSQRGVLDFERLLQGRWGRLDELLVSGQGSVVEQHPPGEYRHRLGLFHRAMHGAAAVRSEELWEAVGSLAPEGLIVDAGAGDGTYLNGFLSRNPGWRALACDLEDVLAAVVATDRLSTHPCNLLDPGERREFVAGHRGGADLLLLSNFIHCYGRGEVAVMLSDLGELIAPDGLLVVHDFFTDGNGFSALYDLHMLVNTYNGRTYTFAETEEMLAGAGFTIHRRLELPSHSHALVARRGTE
jgi:hypothetical protein